jgi:hypothetical protein
MSTLISAKSRSKQSRIHIYPPAIRILICGSAVLAVRTAGNAMWYTFAGLLFCLFAQSLAHASTYYLSPYRSDSNSGTKARLSLNDQWPD